MCDTADNFSYASVKKDFVKPVKPGMFTIQYLVSKDLSPVFPQQINLPLI